MQLPAQDFLRLAEQAHTLLFWDTECGGLSVDYNGIICLSVKPYGQPAETFELPAINQSDKFIIKAAAERLAEADCWVTYFGKGFDVKVVNARLLRWGLAPLEPRPHLDMFFQVKHKFALSRKSQAHVLSFLETQQEKMSVSPNVWADLRVDFKRHMKTLVARCESDTEGLEALYERIKPFVRDITR